ncbi:uncharacterized protein LOC129737589 [Uranotaenia lowii]|uniref:uncharacterized protein LOC129737589 n=1 Tax=Uranotaenia lowii TaxID=190385 RepID=UPI0024792D5A|nr:uncharacterized protein LOC129737589 [Uranotaenia lowii]
MSKPNKNDQRNSCLKRNHLAARQVIAKDLPSFSGNPEEWPIFISTYESTTSMCMFTDEENLSRLRTCLRGEALDAVRSFLIQPSTVRKAIDVLRLRFGQPQFVIDSLKEKVLSMPPLKQDSLNQLIDFSIAVQNLNATIDACGRKEYSRDFSLIAKLVEKLPSPHNLDWARHQRNLKKITLARFCAWISLIAEDACLVTKPTGKGERNKYERAGTTSKARASVNVHAEVSDFETSEIEKSHTGSKGCIICFKNDCLSLDKCSRFQEMSYAERWTAVHEHQLCKKCLKIHRGRCNSPLCGKQGCKYKHHPLLHKILNVVAENLACNTHQTQAQTSLLRYVPVTLYGKSKQIQCYAFLDDGSHITLLDQDLSDELNLQGEPRPLFIKWTGGKQRHEANSQSVNCDISGNGSRRFHLDDVRTVQELQLPYQTLDVAELSTKYGHLRGLPVQSYENVRPRILIGIKHAYVSLVRKSREGKPHEPICIKTHLGWSIYGGGIDGEVSMVHHVLHVGEEKNHSECSLDQAVKNFFDLENMGITKSNDIVRSKDDQRALELLNEMTHFNGERYETGLLWRYPNTHLHNNKEMALHRYHSLMKRLEKDPVLRSSLNEKIDSYLAKGYIRKLTSEEISNPRELVWYLPTFPVTNPNKPGKVRLVWDAAAMYKGQSLNSVLLTGPDQLVSLISVLIKFRESRIAVCGDIREMYHQVKIREQDQHCQRFLWKDNDGDPSEYIMTVMTFGASCSPSSAQFVKNINAKRHAEKYPDASEIIINCTYVDDMLFSVPDEKEAINLAKTVRLINNNGGFEIHNWMSNAAQVLAELEEEPSSGKNLDLISPLATEKVLGMWWETTSDSFVFKINWTRLDKALLEGSRIPTKREVLKTLMSIYDPLGLISHYLMFLKILLQEIWRAEVSWDEMIGDKLNEKWLKFVRLFPALENLRIQRCFHSFHKLIPVVDVQLHTFVDASEDGMAAVVYLRYASDDTVECSLVGSKTRVASLKYL